MTFLSKKKIYARELIVLFLVLILDIYFFIEMTFQGCYFLLQEAAARLEEMKKSVEAKMALRQSNLNPERPG